MTPVQILNIGEYEITYDSKFDRIKLKCVDSWIPFSVHNFMIFLFTLQFKFLESSDEMSLSLRQFPSSIEICRVHGNYVIFYNSSLHPVKLVLSSSSVKILTCHTLMESVRVLQKGDSLRLPGEYQDASERSYF